MISGVNKETGQPLALTRTPKKVLDREDFILLFIKQLQYQDPMKPIENNEMAMQMALFSQVDQLFDLNKNFEKLLDLAQTYQFTSAASLVGKLVKAEGEYGRVENGHFLGAEFELEDPAPRVEAIITDESGRTVRRLDLGALPEGRHTLDWDGKDENGNTVPDGNYRIRILVEGNEQKKIPVHVYARVTGALLGDEPEVILNDHDKIPLKDLEKILSSYEPSRGGGA